MNPKPIDINQRIPLDVLHIALSSYLDGSYSEEYILQQLRLEFKGENRLKKSVRIVNKIILKSPLADFIESNTTPIQQALKKKQDGKFILIALLTGSFSFAFDTLQLFGKFLSVQDLVSLESVKKSLSNIYGGNRATENAIYSVVPMFIEAGLIDRPKLGLYERNEKCKSTSNIVNLLFEEAFKANTGTEEIQEYQRRDPYFSFLGS